MTDRFLHDPFDRDAARAAAADVAYPDDWHGKRVGRQWPEPTPVTIRGNPDPVDMTWQNDTAACIGHPVDWWFPADKVNATTAKQICNTCPLIEPCKAHGIAHERHGVWGGLTVRERQALRGKGNTPPLVLHRRINRAECGTRSGYNRHMRDQTKPCPECKAAWAHYAAMRRGGRVGEYAPRDGDGAA
jgi:hypothetical protein